MDPNTALKTLRDLVSEWEDTRGRGDYMEDAVRHMDDVRDNFRALDDWLSKGGFNPTDWQ